MSEWQDMHKKPIVDFRKFLQERLIKTNPRRQLATDEATKLAKLKGIVEKLKRGERVKRWWTASVDGKINLVVRYGSKPLEFAKGKNAIELASEAAELGELDALIEQQAKFGRRLTLKNKWTNEQKSVYNLGRSSSYSVQV